MTTPKYSFPSRRPTLGLVLTATVSLYATVTVAAPESPLLALNEVGGDQQLLELLAVLDEETELATKSKMNIDFVPGMATVLHGKDLMDRGAFSVYDALTLIPGAEASMSGVGQPQIVFRGAGKNFASGNAKLLLDGIPMNSTLNGQSAIFSIPMEQVKRIEVIRGPGSSIHGEFAFAGVINIITRGDEPKFFARVNGFGATTTGGVVHWRSSPSNLKLSLNFSDTHSNGADVEAGGDKLYGANASNSPGPTNEKQINQSVVFSLDYGAMHVTGHHVRTSQGDYFGLNDILPPPTPQVARSFYDQAIEAEYPVRIGRGANATLTAGWSRFEFKGEGFTILPEGFTQPMPHPITGLPIVFEDGAHGKPYHEEQKLYGGLEVNYKLHGHDLLAGVDLAQVEQTQSWVERDYSLTPTSRPFLPITMTKFTGDESWLADGLSRRIMGIYVQDQFPFTTRLNATIGVRYDDYDDVGSSLSPRFAAVYRVADHHTIKFQYAHAFRPPTFVEMYTQNNPVVSGNPDINPEKLISQEAGYVYNNGRTVTRFTIYHLHLEDLIQADLSQDPAIYTNSAALSYLGTELELVHSLNRATTISANASYLDTHHGAPVAAGLSKLMANASLLLHPAPGLSAALRLRHVGQRYREEGDTRSPVPASNVVDATVSLHNLGMSGLTMRASLSNIFDEPVLIPAPMGTYENDYPRPGRLAWVQFLYSFK